MSRFSSPAVALAYFAFAGMGVVALLVWSGRVSEAFVQQVVLPPVVVVLVAAGIWEYRRRDDAGAGGNDTAGGDDDAP